MKGSIDFMKRNYLFLAFFAAAIGCADKSREKDILTRPEMVKVMEEILIAEEKINHLAISRDSARKVFGVIQELVFENAAMTDTVFRKSFDYYMERPKEMELIYTALVDTLQLREQRFPFRPDQQ
ncbi:MAG: DUF4296 domain-containing protein [Cyclobacteriaceae bacterium]